MHMQNIDDVTIVLGINYGLISLFIYIVSSYFLRKRALKRIKAKLQEGEYIIYKAKIRSFLDLILGFASGMGIGAIIVPFYIFPELHEIFIPWFGFLNRNNMWLFILALIFSISVIFYICSMVTVFTNKRIMNDFAFDFLRKTQKIVLNKYDSLYYSDMKKVIYENIPFLITLLTIWTKDNKKHTLGGYKNLKKIHKVIEEQVGLSKGDIENDSTARTSSN